MKLELANGDPITEDDLHQAARTELKWLLENDQSDLYENWRNSYRYFKNEPRGDESEGRSKLQSADVSDAIEWILPTVIKAFIETPDVVRFDPLNPEDEAQADLESDYTHYYFMKRSRGFQVIRDAVKDALMLKNCVTFTYWDDTVSSRPEKYQQLLEQELARLLTPTDGTEVKVESKIETQIPATDPITGMPVTDPQTGEPVMIPVYDVEIRRYRTQGCARVEVCVPEQFKVRWNHGSIDLTEARFCSYTQEKTRSELIALGYDKDKIADVACLGRADSTYDEIRDEREDVEESFGSGGSGSSVETIDEGQELVRLNRCYMTIDINGDGLEERVVVILGGDDGEVLLDWYECEENPFDSASPFPAQHKFWGYSVYDKLKLIQDLKTKLLRMLSDNLDFLNNPEKKVIPGLVEMDDILVRRVGGLKRMDDLGAYEELVPPQIGPTAFSLMEWADKMRGERVGVDPDAQSVSKIFPDEAMNTAMERLMTAKEEVVALIIRTFGELWFAPMMVKLRKLVMTHMNREEMVRLGKKWVVVDPRNWTDRMTTTVKVGLATGDRLKKLMALEKVGASQWTAYQAGLGGRAVTLSQIIHTSSEFIRASGLGDPDDFWLEPMKIEQEIQQAQQTGQAPSQEAVEAFMERQRIEQMQQAAAQQQNQAAGPQVDPQVLLQIEQMKGQFKLQSDQLNAQMKMQAEQMKAQSDQLKLALEKMKMMQEQMQFEAKERREWAKLASDSEEAADKLAVEAGKAQLQSATQREMATKRSQSGGKSE